MYNYRNDTKSKLVAYVVLGINEDGHKEVLTIEVGENKDMKPFAKDLKTIYTPPDEKIALKRLDEVTTKWSMPVRSWGEVHEELEIKFLGRLE